MSLRRRIQLFCVLCWSIATVMLLLCGQKTPVPHVAVTEFLAASAADVSLPSFSSSGTEASWEADTPPVPKQIALNRINLPSVTISCADGMILPLPVQSSYLSFSRELSLLCLTERTGMIPFSQAPPSLFS